MVGLLYVISFPLVDICCDLRTPLKYHLVRWAPLYFVFGPTAFTYFILCGTISAFVGITLINEFVTLGPDGVLSQSDASDAGIFIFFHAVEWITGALGILAFWRLYQWLALPSFWYGLLVASFALCAIFRDARNIDTGNGFETGPGVLFSPLLVDLIPVAIASLLCLRFLGLRNTA